MKIYKNNSDKLSLKNGTPCKISHKVVSRRKFLKEDYIGKRFGKWKVLDYVGKAYLKNRPQFARMFLCECECGRTSSVALSNLVYGLTKGCKICHLTKVDPVINDPIRRVWYRINSQCVEPWKNFDTFKHDVLPGRLDTLKKLGELDPNERTTLGAYGIYFLRKNPMEKYSPENCYWGTRKDVNHVPGPFPEGITLTELAKHTFYTAERIRQFSKKNGKNLIERALLPFIVKNLITKKGGKRKIYSRQAIPFLLTLRTIKGVKNREKFIAGFKYNLIINEAT